MPGLLGAKQWLMCELREGLLFQQAARHASQRGEISGRNQPWLDPILVRMDRLFGYGRKVRTEDVWK